MVAGVANTIWMTVALASAALGIAYTFFGFRLLDWWQARADRRERRRLGLPDDP